MTELDETIERNLDYLISINTITGYLLLIMKRPDEAMEFINISERIVGKLVLATAKSNSKESSTIKMNLNIDVNLSTLEELINTPTDSRPTSDRL